MVSKAECEIKSPKTNVEPNNLGSFPSGSGLGNISRDSTTIQNQLGSFGALLEPDFSPAIMSLKKTMFRLVYKNLILRDGDQNEYRKILHFFLTDFVVIVGLCVSESDPFAIVQNHL